MNEETKNKFSNFLFKPGDKIKFYIEEISSKDNRIILTEENIQDKINKVHSFLLENKDKNMNAEIICILKYGMIVKINEFVNGMIPLDEFRKHKLNYNDYNIGENIKVFTDHYDNNKIFFKL